MFLTIFLVLLSMFLYRTVIKPTFYWKERGVAYQKPWPIIGNMEIMKQKSAFQQSIDFYKAFPDLRYNGIFHLTTPMLLIRDVDLLKQVMVKDFDHFTDHNSVFSEEIDPMMAKHLFALAGQKWRDMRTAVSPSFTSSKMRAMFALMLESSEKFTAYLEKQTNDVFVAEFKDVYSRLTNDVIASVVFGYSCDSIAEPENEFYLMAEEATSFTVWRSFKFMLVNMSPFLGKLFRIRFFSEKISNFFRRIVKDNIRERKEGGIVRPDMIQLLMDARSGWSRHEENELDMSVNEGFAAVDEAKMEHVEKYRREVISDDDIAAQALVFVFSGFDTIATLVSFVSYELAVNVGVQEKLQAEIDKSLKTCNGKITYNALLGMKYLDMVISETLRKWPPGYQLDRVCVKDYVIKPVALNQEPLLVEKGTVLMIPVAGIHMDPEFYPNPEKFDPERFSEENKQNIKPFTYMPFGAGPRNCIASRFALLESKTFIFHLLSKFTLTAVERTPIPMVLNAKKINIVPRDGFWLGLTLRKPLGD